MSLKLSHKITEIPGVGPKLAEKFTRLNIRTIGDILNHFPTRYIDTSKIIPICDITKTEDIQTVKGELLKISNFKSKRGMKMTSATIADQTAKIDILWFNQHFLTRTLKPGQQIFISGTVDFSKKPQFISPLYEVAKKYKEPTHLARISPTYPQTEGLTSKIIRKIFKTLELEQELWAEIEDNLPEKIKLKNKLIDKREAYRILHFPESLEEIDKARERMAFGEMYAVIKKMQQQKKNQIKYHAPSIKNNKKLISDFLKELTFTPTAAQERSIDEVLSDLEKEVPMHRLLEGDVGSGKTLVAVCAALNCTSRNFQTAILAPTQVLAEQHYKTFVKFLPWLKEEFQLVTSTTKKAEPKKILIGTHAILHHSEELIKNLGLVIIDEQHRFGVKQRDFLSEFTKEFPDQKVPHVLTMTATPIPRSLALTLFGDLEISVIDEMPKGRIPVDTHLVPKSKRNDSYNWIRKQIKDGGQAFVICPLVEESEKLEVKSATEEYKRLANEVFPDLKVELLHGRIKPQEKEKILDDFKNKKFDILVSTAVVEVGIDIPNATVIVIEDAERFGLAQLHQFRGRVGRSDKKSYCLLFTESDSADAIERLNYFASTNKGLAIAEYDLERRGPGEVYGTKQAGIPDLKFASLMDIELISRVKRAIETI